MSTPDPRFAACSEVFRFLSERFGFTEPEYERIGRETYVRFHRGDQTVSIAHELGSTPIVELFYPSVETGEPPVPWAAKNGVQRARRIPRLHVDESIVVDDLESYRRYLQASAEALEEVEQEWLAT